MFGTREVLVHVFAILIITTHVHKTTCLCYVRCAVGRGTQPPRNCDVGVLMTGLPERFIGSKCFARSKLEVLGYACGPSRAFESYNSRFHLCLLRF